MTRDEVTQVTPESRSECLKLIEGATLGGLYQDVLDLVRLLDQPVRQVAIETKFVEVNEQRAKEASADERKT